MTSWKIELEDPWGKRLRRLQPLFRQLGRVLSLLNVCNNQKVTSIELVARIASMIPILNVVKLSTKFSGSFNMEADLTVKDDEDSDKDTS